MTTWTPIIFRVSACALALALAGRIENDGMSLAAGAPVQDLPAGPERTVVLRVCTECHGADSFVGLRNTRREWRSVVDSMRVQGAVGTNEEFEQVVGYLTRELGVPLKINRATATELEAAMELTTGQAEALVAYREKNGPFKTVDDLLKVPDINPARILEQKKNLSFE